MHAKFSYEQKRKKRKKNLRNELKKTRMNSSDCRVNKNERSTFSLLTFVSLLHNIKTMKIFWGSIPTNLSHQPSSSVKLQSSITNIHKKYHNLWDIVKVVIVIHQRGGCRVGPRCSVDFVLKYLLHPSYFSSCFLLFFMCVFNQCSACVVLGYSFSLSAPLLQSQRIQQYINVTFYVMHIFLQNWTPWYLSEQINIIIFISDSSF